MDRIRNLLNSHQIKLLNDDGFYLVHMLVHMGEAARRDRANMYYFAPAPLHNKSSQNVKPKNQI